MLMPLMIFYDGSCEFCARKAKNLVERDIDGRLILTDITENPYEPELYDIPAEKALAEIHGVRETISGTEIYSGYELLVEIERTLGTQKTALILSLPVIRHIGRVLYTLVSKYRRFL